MTMNTYGVFGLIFLSATLLSCAKNPDVSNEVIDEVAQQVGDVMASMDEIGGSTGTLSQHQKSFLRLQDRLQPAFEFFALTPKAYADSCISSGFAMCDVSSRILKRTFSGCTLGLASITGTVSLKWGGTGSGCSLGLPAPGGYITRVPDFTVTGLRGATLSVSREDPTGVGQRLTYASGNGPSAQFKFSSDGIRRVFTLPDGKPLIDLTSSTVQDLTLTGAERSPSRVLSGGVLRVKNNQSDFSCDFIPSNVTWSSNCNCPVSGNWQATCSDGSRSSIRLSGCGTADFTFGLESQTISFDRCGEI
ncbi:MAG: hypothetical protein KGP28_11040 [Bdellovibrionales bacterium]|nr:hypothetical protein [Bdellovibrionales bacterium]